VFDPDVAALTPLLTATYQRLLMENRPLALQHLSCIDLHLNIRKRMDCYATGELYTSTLMNTALVAGEVTALTARGNRKAAEFGE